MGARKAFGPKMAEFIQKNCVPVAIPGGNSQTLQTAAGKVLGAPKPGWNTENYPKAVEEFYQLPESERKPKEMPAYTHHIVRLAPPPGGLVARIYIRGLERDAQGELRPDPKQSKDYWGPQRDFMWLTESETKSLAAAQGRVPPAIAHRIFRHLTGEIVTLIGGWSGKDVRAGELSLTPEKDRLRLEGFAKLANDAGTRTGDFRLLGYLNKALTRFDIVALGTYTNAGVTDYYVKVGQKKELTIGIVFELAAPDSLGYGTMPWALFDGWGKGPGDKAIERYFGTNPYGGAK